MLPLSGYRIVDFGTALVGGVSPRLLVDYGAEVIKVESRVSLDGFRRGRPSLGDEAARADESLWPELQPALQSANRGKLGVTLNMNKPEGLALVKQLIARSDVVMNNFSPGVLLRRGLDYESLRAIKPDIILVSMPGAGETGPLRDYVSYAMTAEALSGMGGLFGYENDAPIGAMPLAWGDIINAISGAMAVVSALYHRDRTGEGQYIESAQLEASAALMGVPYFDYVMNGRVAEPGGNVHPMLTPHNIYPTGDGRWVAIATRTDEEWARLCRAAGRPEWISDPRFSEWSARLANRRNVDAALGQWTQERSSEEIVQTLQEHGVAATPVLRLEDQAVDEYFVDRGAFTEVIHPVIGSLRVPGMAARLSDDAWAPTAAPMLGQHNDYVLGEVLGLSEEERQRLVDDEVIY